MLSLDLVNSEPLKPRNPNKPRKQLHCKQCGQEVKMKIVKHPRRYFEHILEGTIDVWTKFNMDNNEHMCDRDARDFKNMFSSYEEFEKLKREIESA